ncbi:MAG TPA: hypothetical protein VFG30_18845 [Polyangiales bacterium]|nr:hypothetical protein [Polyangiales bacterium]
MKRDRMQRLTLSLACVFVVKLACGCATHPDGPASPEATITAFARALNEGNLPAAYAMMSEDYRSHVSAEAWQKLMEENSQEVIEISNSLTHVRGPARVKAELDHVGEGDLVLVQRDGKWFVASDVARVYDQSTPRAALHAFVRAIEHKRYDVVLRLVPNADKEGMTTASLEKAWSGAGRDEISRVVGNLKDHLSGPIEIVGNHATLPYGERMRVQFLREDGVWKIENPE